jgi:ABC-type multidrug transport system ATPase subunit
VDPVRRQLLWNVIADLGRQGTAVLLVTHNLAEAERVLNRLAIIDKGRILREGSPSSLRTLVTDRLRLELTLSRPITPHPALATDLSMPGCFLFDHADLARVSAWVLSLRETGDLLDFRIGPPSLDDIYTATIGSTKVLEEAL